MNAPTLSDIEEGLALYRSLGSCEEAKAFFDNRYKEMRRFNRDVRAMCAEGASMKKPSKMQAKVGKVMGEFKAGSLHSGSKQGPEVTSRKQAIAIGMSEGRKASRGKRK